MCECRESKVTMRGRAELLVGVTVGVLGVISASVATFAPLYPTQNSQAISSVFQEQSVPTALLICSTFVVLSLWILIAAVAHAHWPDTESLYLLWFGTIALSFLSTIGGQLLWLETSIPFAMVGVYLMPEAALAIVCAILASVHQAMSSRA